MTSTQKITYVVSYSDGEHDNVIDTFTDKDAAMECFNESVKERTPDDTEFDVSIYSDWDDEDEGCEFIDTIASWTENND